MVSPVNNSSVSPVCKSSHSSSSTYPRNKEIQKLASRALNSRETTPSDKRRRRKRSVYQDITPPPKRRRVDRPTNTKESRVYFSSLRHTDTSRSVSNSRFNTNYSTSGRKRQYESTNSSKSTSDSSKSSKKRSREFSDPVENSKKPKRKKTGFPLINIKRQISRIKNSQSLLALFKREKNNWKPKHLCTAIQKIGTFETTIDPSDRDTWNDLITQTINQIENFKQGLSRIAYGLSKKITLESKQSQEKTSQAAMRISPQESTLFQKISEELLKKNDDEELNILTKFAPIEFVHLTAAYADLNLKNENLFQAIQTEVIRRNNNKQNNLKKFNHKNLTDLKQAYERLNLGDPTFFQAIKQKLENLEKNTSIKPPIAKS